MEKVRPLRRERLYSLRAAYSKSSLFRTSDVIRRQANTCSSDGFGRPSSGECDSILWGMESLRGVWEPLRAGTEDLSLARSPGERGRSSLQNPGELSNHVILRANHRDCNRTQAEHGCLQASGGSQPTARRQELPCPLDPRPYTPLPTHQRPIGASQVGLDPDCEPSAGPHSGAKADRERTGEQAQGEGQALNEVALRQATGFLRQAMNPLHAAALHPVRRAPHIAGDEAEADADAQPPGAGMVAAQAADQALLLGRAETT